MSEPRINEAARRELEGLLRDWREKAGDDLERRRSRGASRFLGRHECGEQLDSFLSRCTSESEPELCHSAPQYKNYRPCDRPKGHGGYCRWVRTP